MALPIARFATLPVIAGATGALAEGVDTVQQAAASQPFIGLLFMIALAGIATATTLVHLAGRSLLQVEVRRQAQCTLWSK
jgi:hypothetical protein